MILATTVGNREVRLFEAAGFIPRPGSSDAIWSGGQKSPALAIAAVGACVKLISEQIGGFVMRPYTGNGAMSRRPIYDGPQAELFQYPAEGWTSFDLWSDTIATLELEEHAFIWKSKTSRGKVAEMWPIDPAYVQVTLKNGVKTIRAQVEGKMQDITQNVIHIRSWSAGPTAVGISTPDMHRSGLKVAASYDLYRGRYLDNDGTPGIILEVPGSPDKQKRQDMLQGWMKRHAGVNQAGKPGLLWGGAKANQLTPNLRDSQAAEVADSIVRDVGRMFRFYPLELLHGEIKGSPRTAEASSDIFVRFTCMTRMRRLERAVSSDSDLFPNRRSYARLDTSELLRADFATAATVAHNLIQVGAATPNEGRAMVGLPPSTDPDADKLLKIPVGGGVPAGMPTPIPEPDPADF